MTILVEDIGAVKICMQTVSMRFGPSRRAKPLNKSKQYDLLSYMIVLIFCAGAYYVTLGFSKSHARISADPVGPDGFPRLLIGLMALFAVAGVVKSIFAKDGDPKPHTTLKDFEILLKFIGVFIVYIVGMRYTGYCVATLLYAMFNMWWMGVRKPGTIAIVGVAVTVVLYVAFGVFLKADLPPGFLI